MARQSRDRRVKICISEDCKYAGNHKGRSVKRYSYDDKFCSFCGAELFLVCAKCFGKIEDLGPDHTVCLRCESKEDPRLKLAGDVLKAVSDAPGKVASKVKKIKR